MILNFYLEYKNVRNNLSLHDYWRSVGAITSQKNIKLKQHFIKDIGEITIRKSQKAKRLTIRVKSADNIEVVLPNWVPYQTGIGFAIRKKNWIIKHINKSNSIVKKSIFDEQTKFKTRWHDLLISKENRENINIHINSSTVKVSYPSNLNAQNQKVQVAVKYGITETLRIEAKEYLPGRIKILAEKFGFQHNKVFLKNQKTLWGSCSSKNNININIHVMRLPQHLLDYILIHELAHTVQKNHGKDFWKLVDQCVGSGKLLARELKGYSIQL